jgi:hypothetical protein
MGVNGAIASKNRTVSTGSSPATAKGSWPIMGNFIDTNADRAAEDFETTVAMTPR